MLICMRELSTFDLQPAENESKRLNLSASISRTCFGGITTAFDYFNRIAARRFSKRIIIINGTAR